VSRTLSMELPHSIEAEKAILGSLMVDVEAFGDVLDLEPRDFYRDCHGRLFELMLFMNAHDQPVSALTIFDRLKEGARLPQGDDPGNGVRPAPEGTTLYDFYGEVWYIAGLGDDVPFRAELPHHVAQIREMADRRRLLQGMAEERESLLTGSHSAGQARESLIEMACTGNDGPTSAPISSVLVGLADDLAEELVGTRQVYIPTGILSLDNAHDFGGITTEGLTYIIGASGMGKTSLFNRLATGMAAQGRAVYLYGTETGMARRTRDLAFSLAGIDARAWAHATTRRAQLAQGGHDTSGVDRQLYAWHDRIQMSMLFLDRLPIITNDSGKTVEQVCRQIRQYHRQGRCTVAIVDYLQDFATSPGISPKPIDQIGHASKMLKEVASQLCIPVIVGAQRKGEMELNAALSQATDRTMPKLVGDLIPRQIQWCSKAYQDAEEVYSLYRRDYYADRYPDIEHMLPGEHGRIEIHACKRRSGPLTSWAVDFTGPSKWVGGRPRALDIHPPLREAGK
jgi:replicative DNA helicase